MVLTPFLSDQIGFSLYELLFYFFALLNPKPQEVGGSFEVGEKEYSVSGYGFLSQEIRPLRNTAKLSPFFFSSQLYSSLYDAQTPESAFTYKSSTSCRFCFLKGKSWKYSIKFDNFTDEGWKVKFREEAWGVWGSAPNENLSHFSQWGDWTDVDFIYMWRSCQPWPNMKKVVEKRFPRLPEGSPAYSCLLRGAQEKKKKCQKYSSVLLFLLLSFLVICREEGIRTFKYLCMFICMPVRLFV